MKRISLLSLFCIMFIAASLYAQTSNCKSSSYNLGPYPFIMQDLQGHKTGAHIVAMIHYGSCFYGNGSGGYCSVLSSADTDVTISDTGVLTNSAYIHQRAVANKGGSAFGTSNASLTKSDTEGAGSVAQCGFTGCTYGLNISGSGEGGGFTLSTTGATPLWVGKHDFVNACLPEQYVPPTCYDGNTPPTGITTALPKCSSSPLIIDTTGQGFKMSDPEVQYITFDLIGNGKYQQVSWPMPGSGNAWLVNTTTSSVISSGLQLFGNFTPQPVTALPGDKNGFRALAVYDQIPKGGNYDLVIDSKDAIWSHLRLWIDTHCQVNRNLPCRSLPSELYTLESKGIHSIGLVYQGSNKKDVWGNAFKYTSVLNPTTEDRQVSDDKRGFFDVWLVAKKN